MVVQALKDIFVPVFSACADWTTMLLDKVDGGKVVLASFIIVLIVGMLFIPMRGHNLVAGWDEFRDFNKNAMHKPKYSNGVRKDSDSSYKGRFEKRGKYNAPANNKP